VLIDLKKKFDFQLERGQIHEHLARWLICGDDVVTAFEVKSEREQPFMHGNLFIECECNGKPSGIAITEAKWWLHFPIRDGECCFMLAIPVEKLRAIVRAWNLPLVCGGDRKGAKGYLMPLDRLASLFPLTA
jgi:hypothetical protein